MKTLITYGSTTGNTEFVARTAEKLLQNAGHEVTIEEADELTPAGLCKNYDLVLFGCSTWSDDEICLQDNFIDLFDNFDRIEASGKKTAVFGCGDKSYTHFCGAVDAIEEKLHQMGADVVDTLKIDGKPHSDQQVIKNFVNNVLERCK